MKGVIAASNLLFVTLDTLRYDVAQGCFARGETPTLASILPEQGWEKRHAPGSFTYSSHHSMFAGFLPTPCTPGPHPRLFAAAFSGSESTDEETFIYPEATWIEALAARGYRTICIGGTGFFNKEGALGSVLPNLFQESHWSPEIGVTDPRSAHNQFELAARRIGELHKADPTQRTALFINVSALHQPNYFYVEGRSAEEGDDVESQAAALREVDSQLPLLLTAMEKTGAPWFAIVCSDHGTAYGEKGHTGHRHAQEVVWEVPYAHAVLAPEGKGAVRGGGSR